MFWVTKVFAPALLVLGAGTAMVMADADGNQPPFGKGDFGQPGKGFPGKGGDDKKTDDKKVEEKKGQPGDKKGPAPKSDAVVDAWLKTLLDKITDPHDTVRDSARGAIVAVGPPALPALQTLADGTDPAKAVAARKLIGAIQGRGPGQPGQPGGNRGGGGGGFGGMGGGMGFPGMPGMGPMGPDGMGPGGFPGGQPGMNPGGGRGGPGGQPGMNPGGGRGGFGGWGGGRGGREESDIEVAPMPRSASR